MATFFGEVIFSTSRACHADSSGFYDDDDDEEEESNDSQIKRFEIQMKVKEEKPNPSSVIISSGILANEFLQGCLSCNENKEIGCLHVKKNLNDAIETVDFHPRKLKSSPLYLTTKGVLICCCSEDVSPDLATDFVKQILSVVNVSCPILVLSTHHTSKLTKAEVENGCISYCLQSPAYTPPTNIYDLLPQPSVLDSIPAAIMTSSILEDRPCLICSSYVETISPGNVDLVTSDFEKMLKVAPFNGNLIYNEKVVMQQKKGENFDRYM